MTQSSTPQGAVCEHCDKEIKLIGKCWHLSFGDLEQCSGATLCLSKESLFSQHEPVAEPASTGEPPRRIILLDTGESGLGKAVAKALAARPSEPSAPEYCKCERPYEGARPAGTPRFCERCLFPLDPEKYPSTKACDWPFEGCCTQKELCLSANRCLKNLPVFAASPKEVAEQSAEPRGITDTYEESDENPNNIRFTYPAAPQPVTHSHAGSCHGLPCAEKSQPVAGEGPRCVCPDRSSYEINHVCKSPKASEGTPKLEEIARKIAGAIVDTISDNLRWPTSSASTNRRDEIIGQYVPIISAILRPFITPACAPPEGKRVWETTWNTKFGPAIWVNGKIFLRLEAGIEMSHVSEQDPVPEWRKLLTFVMDAIREKELAVATPASTGEANGKSFLGLPVYVDNPQFTGYGMAEYDSGDRKRVIGVLLENGNTWEYDAATVREAHHEEFPKMPRFIRERFAAPSSVPTVEPKGEKR